MVNTVEGKKDNKGRIFVFEVGGMHAWTPDPTD